MKRGVNVEMNRHLLRSCERAVDCMHEVNTYINRFKKDAEYKESVRKLTDRIRNMRVTNGLASDYGQLMFDGPMQFKLQVDSKFNKKAYLMCFQARILVFEVDTNEEHNSSLKDNYFYIASIKITNKMSLAVEEKKTEGIITVLTLENFIPNNRESFNIKVPLGQELEELKEKFQALINKAAPRPDAKHRGHDFENVAPQHAIDIRKPKPPPCCAECNLYLFGQIFTGFKCIDCDSYYHEYCFKEGNPDPYFGR